MDENNKGSTSVETNETERPTVVVRKAKKKKKSSMHRKEYDVQVIPATKGVTPPGETPKAKRVAAYCRVSTDEEAQSTSFDLQVKHYTEYIGAHEDFVTDQHISERSLVERLADQD